MKNFEPNYDTMMFTICGMGILIILYLILFIK